MTIYVDDFKGRLGRMVMCHMMSDTSVDELHLFAEKLGLRREWFQNGSAPHYDVSKEKRALAVKIGAVELPISSGKEWQRVYRAARSLKSTIEKGGH